MLSIALGFVGLLLLDLLSICLCLVQENVARPTALPRPVTVPTTDQQIFLNLPRETWCLDTCDGLMSGRLVRAGCRSVAPHGSLFHDFRADKAGMADYDMLFHRLNYNVVLIDNRATGQSEGKYTGYGYLERIDARCWVDMTIAKLGTETEIVLFGTAMVPPLLQ